ncbi:hypothetical protein DCAR_0522491 [Daucus carota subsp. sativus]|uniref:Uncharacterized protein n=1 Tax=Daucus carota subsp. sativus TaxID=79200 RepID=A0A164ZUG3_DAUCS|nr:hypothetical protein DCAR_0522491 [Daucus carota subsp. sativus]
MELSSSKTRAYKRGVLLRKKHAPSVSIYLFINLMGRNREISGSHDGTVRPAHKWLQ